MFGPFYTLSLPSEADTNVPLSPRVSASGALLVKLAEGEINVGQCNIVDEDIAAIVDGIAGVGAAARTQGQIVTALGSPAQAGEAASAASGKALASRQALGPTGTCTTVTSTADWTSVALPANTLAAHVHVNADAYLQTGGDTEPAANGVPYLGGLTPYQIPCSGSTKLWVKRISSDVTVTANCFGAV